MERLEADELVHVLDLLQATTQAADPDEFARAALSGVKALIPCAVASLNEVVPNANRVGHWMEPETFPLTPTAAELLAQMAGEHPLIRYYAATSDGQALRISDFWTHDEFHASRLYQELYRPMQVEYQMSVALPVPRPSVLGVVLNRHDRDFTDREQLLLNTARPHLVQAWRNAQYQLRLRLLLDAASDVMREGGSGVVVLSDPPEELTPGAIATLHDFFGRPSARSALPPRVARWVTGQRADTHTLALSRPLTAERDGQRVLLRYVPAQRAHPGAIVLSGDHVQAERTRVGSLGLSPREAEVVRLVIRGASNAEIAAALHVVPGTVKKHLDNVYDKLGVRSRGALTAFVMGIAI